MGLDVAARTLHSRQWVESRSERQVHHQFAGDLMKRVGQALVLLIVVAAPAYAGGVVVTPEPATIGLVATGIGAVGAFALWRKRRR
jgi:hypothetical protein